MCSMKKMTEWRQFEELVARIEQSIGPRGAIVTSPDRIRDMTTGKLREVDASIRYRVGTVDILITVECRKRSRKADDTWLEQLATKRAKLGAAKTIAVSAKGFSESAVLTARHHGIELRTLAAVESRDLIEWFLPTSGITHVFRDVDELESIVFLQCTDGAPLDYGLKAPDSFEPIFHHPLIQSPFPAALLFKFLELSEPEKFWKIPLDGTMSRLTFRFTLKPGPLLLQGRDGLLPVHHIRLSALVGYKAVTFDLANGTHHRYTLPTGEHVEHTSFTSELFDMPVRFDHQQDLSGEKHVSFEFLPNPDEPEA